MPQITISELLSLIGSPFSPTLIDIRIDDDVALNPVFIPSSVKRHFKEVDVWADEFKAQKCVIICHKGLKLSEGVAALMRLKGIDAVSLTGGMVGYLDTKSPVINSLTEGQLWVTRERPKIDRIACPWLITRFIDKNARFLYVKTSEVLGVAEKFNALPYDVEGVKYSHRGETCTFDTLLSEYGLNSPALQKLATIVRGADTDRHDLAGEAKGLFAVSLGFSHLYKDDLSQLNAALPLYDALYAYCLNDKGERHFWKQGV